MRLNKSDVSSERPVVLHAGGETTPRAPGESADAQKWTLTGDAESTTCEITAYRSTALSTRWEGGSLESKGKAVGRKKLEILSNWTCLTTCCRNCSGATEFETISSEWWL